METRKTKKGYVIDITNDVDGCLIQGGVCGRRLFVSFKTAGTHADPDDEINDQHTMVEEMLMYYIEQGCPCRVLRTGHVIE